MTSTIWIDRINTACDRGMSDSSANQTANSRTKQVMPIHNRGERNICFQRCNSSSSWADAADLKAKCPTVSRTMCAIKKKRTWFDMDSRRRHFFGDELPDAFDDIGNRGRLQSRATVLRNANIKLVFHVEQELDQVEGIESEALQRRLRRDRCRIQRVLLCRNRLNSFEYGGHDSSLFPAHAPLRFIVTGSNEAAWMRRKNSATRAATSSFRLSSVST